MTATNILIAFLILTGILPNIYSDNQPGHERIIELVYSRELLPAETDSDDDVVEVSRPRRAVTALKEKLWPNGTVPYVINENITAEVESNIMAAIAHWEKHTCVRFVNWTTEVDYVEFAPGKCGCCSFVGRQAKGRQFVNLTPYCAVYGVAVHEIGHTIGFWHEHSRPDRDKFVKILIENIKPERIENFFMKSHMDIDSLGQPYDYQSIMHYRRATFSRNDQDTMQPIVEDVLIGQREALSPGDILQANLLYDCPKPLCDFEYDQASGDFSSPNFPLHYYKDHNCTWVIHASQDDWVELKFEKFEVEPTDNCTFDYLELRRGLTSSGPIIGRLCGIGQPGQLVAKGPMWLRFTSDISVTMMGFKGKYNILAEMDDKREDYVQYDDFGYSSSSSSEDGSSDSGNLVVVRPPSTYEKSLVQYRTDCSKSLESDSGSIASPISLALSDIHFDCRWTISGDGASGIQVTLDPQIAHLHEVRCIGEVFIRTKPSSATQADDANDISDTGRYEFYRYDCSNLTRTSFVVQSDQILIIWSSSQHPGFKLDYVIDFNECQSEEGNASRCEQLCVNKIDGYECRCRPGYTLEGDARSCRPKLAQFNDLCNSQLTSTRGMIRADDSSLSEHDCTFEILQPLGHKIHLVFSLMNLPESENCTEAFVEVSKGLNEDDSKGIFCGTDIPSPISTSTGYLKLRLHFETAPNGSDSQTPYFLASFVAHKNEKERCFHRLKNQGELLSPHHPSKYPNDATCVYKISVAAAHRIRLKFSSIDIETTKQCQFDHVVVRDGRNRASPLIGRYCGRKIPPEIISSGRHLWIMFLSDESHTGRGFVASFSTVPPDGVTTGQPDVDTTADARLTSFGTSGTETHFTSSPYYEMGEHTYTDSMPITSSPTSITSIDPEMEYEEEESQD